MSKALMKSLKADLPALAEMIRSKGRGRDTMLAHITPREAALLKRRGGSGTINPDTGLPEFDDFADYSMTGADTPAPVSPVYDVIQPSGTFTQTDPTTGFEQQYVPGGQAYAPQAPTYQLADYNAPAAAQGFNATPQTYADTQAAEDYAYGQAFPSGTVPAGQQLPAGGVVSGTAYAPSTLTQPQLQQLAAGEALAEYPGPTDQAGTKEKSYLEKLLSPDGLAKLGVAGLLGAGLTKGVAAPAARQATQQAQQAAQQYQQLAQPYRQTSQNLIQSAQTGALTPSNLQAVNTARQIAAQNIKSRGGVGVEQAANQVAQLEANLLEKQFSTGLSLAGIADQFDAQAINTSLSANQGVVASNAAFYAQLANMLAPFVFGTGQMTSPTQPRTSTTGVV